MERGSNKHSARMDDALDAEVRGLVTAGHDTHAEEWKSAEPSGEDQPEVDLSADGDLHGGVPDGMTEDDVEERSRLAAYLGKEVWPASGEQLRRPSRRQPRGARTRCSPASGSCRRGRVFDNLQDAWHALGGGVEEHRF